jgi:hypothetical protein
MSAAASDEPVRGTSGVIHIDCRQRSGEPTEYLVSFGGNRDGVGAFYLARATSFDPLTALLRKLGVPGSTIETALQVLEAQPHHKIPNVILTRAQMRELSL